MSYPSGPPGNPGYQSGPSAAQYNAPTQQFGQAPEAAPAEPSKLPLYLAVLVAVLGLFIYFTTFALDSGAALGPLVGILAGLMAGVALVPKQTSHFAVVAVLSVLGLLVVLAGVVTIGASNLGWASYLLIAFALLQAIAAVSALLLDAGVITAPVPKPKYEEHQSYGQYGSPSPYYGQPQQGQPQQGQPQQGQPQHGQPQHGGPPHQQGPQQRGYPQQYGGHPNGPSTGGFMPQPPQGPPQQSGPPTPPTGFPAFGQPQGAPPSPSAQSHETPHSQQQAAPQSTPPQS